MNKKYSRAYTEVLEILSHFSEEEYNKIPKEKIELYESNKDKDYKFSIDPTKDLAEQNISKEAKAIIITLFRDYFASEEQKDTLNGILLENENKAEKKKQESYNPDKLFENNNKVSSNETTDDVSECTALVERKENIFNKIWTFIKGLFKKQ